MLQFLRQYKESFEALEAIFTILAFVVAGLWTYMLVVRKRERFPRAKLAQAVTTCDISESQRLVRVHLLMHNDGDVLFNVSNGFCRVQVMCPWSHETIREFLDTSKEKRPLRIPWPLCEERSFTFQGQKELEPKESDEIIMDFVLGKEITKIAVYSFVENASKPGRNLGWSITTVHDLNGSRKNEQELSMAEKERERQEPRREQRQEQAQPRPQDYNPAKDQKIQSQSEERPKNYKKN